MGELLTLDRRPSIQFDLPTAPDSKDIERALLGALLLEPEQISEVEMIVRARDFAMEAHRVIYKAAIDLWTDGSPVDPILVADWLARNGHTARAGGLAYVVGLDLDLPDSSRAVEYAEGVRRLAGARAGGELVMEAAKLMLTTGDPQAAAGLLEKATKLAEGHRHRVTGGAFADRIDEDVERYQALRAGEVRSGIPTGWSGFDEELIGFGPGELVVVGGYAGAGKTTFVEQMALQQARAGYRPLYVSLEMSPEQTSDRIWQGALGLSQRDLRGGKFSDEALEGAARDLREAGWPKRFTACYPRDREIRVVLSEIRSWFRLTQNSGSQEFDLVVVDHLHRIRVDGCQERRIEAGRAASSLKDLAQQLEVPVLAPAQVARSGVRDGQNSKSAVWKGPRRWHLKESGDIEQEADTILMLHRDVGTSDNVTKVLIDKVRQGEEGRIVGLVFDSRTRRLRQESVAEYEGE